MQGSLMTNAAIDTTVAAADGQTITVKYKQGDKVDEKKVLITPHTVIVRYVPFLERDGSLTDKGWAAPALFPIIDSLSEKQRNRVGFGMVPPNMNIIPPRIDAAMPARRRHHKYVK